MSKVTQDDGHITTKYTEGKILYKGKIDELATKDVMGTSRPSTRKVFY
jgi:hypothetical protein